MNRLIQDVMYALRQLRKAPGFALIVVLTLSLGIGAAAAVFSVVDAALLRPLPFAHQDRLVSANTNSQSGYQQPASYLSYLDERAQLRTFTALAGYSSGSAINLEGPSGPVSLRVVKGTDNFFDVFGVKPIVGRTFLPGEDQSGRDDIAVLSYEVWQTQFGGQASAVGKVVRLDGAPYTVIGVMPSGFRFPLSARNAIYTPLHAKPEWAKSRGTHWLPTVGLLKDGVSREQGQADLTRVLTDIGRAYPDSDAGRTGSLIPLAAHVNTTARGSALSGPLGMLGLAVLALLGIACVNVAGLLLARGVKREREIALRAAVGAGRLRLVRQLLTESLVLSAAGLAGGILVAWVLLAALRSFLVEAIARGADVHMNTTVLLVMAVLSVLTSVAASLAPAVRLSGMDPNRALRAGGGAGTGVGQHRLRSLFVVTQVALSLVLLVVSGLLLRNLRDLLHTNLGFDPKTILTMEINLSQGRYEGRDPLVAFYQPFLERVSHLPGVVGVGVTTGLPVLTNGTNSEVHITGQPPYPKNQEMLAEIRFVSEGYFDAMGMKLVRGRMLSPGLDKADNPAGTVVVNEAFRRKFFSSVGDPVGTHIDDGDQPEHNTGIAGMVTDVRQDLQQAPLAEMDWLIDEIDAKDRLGYMSNMMLAVRSNGDLTALTPELRSALHEVDATVPFKTPETMTQVVNESLVFERMEGWLYGIFAALALLLAVIGLYGLVQHEVELRTREIGLRMALGSTRSMVMSRIMRRVAVLMAGGVCVGLVLTVALKKMLAAVVVMHATHDYELLAALTAVWIAIGVLASVAPARRAASIDPVKALRIE
jgi:putative ABC transport system permease protein